NIRIILQLPGLEDNSQSYEARKAGNDQRLNYVLIDIGEAFATWKVDREHKPSQLKRKKLNLMTKDWYDFV
ncbi:hypothetical protein PIB30_102996, partial [Stylosanthes scabra]|nr:hypothetical protein [Stylosanthes scabra]